MTPQLPSTMSTLQPFPPGGICSPEDISPSGDSSSMLDATLSLGSPLAIWPLFLCVPHWWNFCRLFPKCPGEHGQRNEGDLRDKPNPRLHPRPLAKSCVTVSKLVTLSELTVSSA